ncbi:MAG: LysR family transcriptional regulator [Lachnospiraceae bacterium]|jgi:DNA-binding transcriptional LysR family regulator|nr:LysR family transcriptional regulator [Lachnospiraceae bacterium]
MDIKKFQLFVDVAETNNFTKSGERMGYTQSGVSHILKSLETDMGFPLFIRNKQGVRLTKNAEIILPLIRSMLSRYEILEQTVNDLNGLETGRLVIATYSSISVNWMPPIIHRFQKVYPGIDISLMEGGADDIVEWLNADIADFAFVSHRNMESMEWIPFCEDPLVAVLPKDYPPPASGVFPIKDFEGKCFIISAMGTDYDIHYALETSGVKPDMRFSATDDHTIIAMVANKLGVSILPQLMLYHFDEQVSSYLLEPYYSRDLGIAVKSKVNMSPAAVKFLEITKQILPELLSKM